MSLSSFLPKGFGSTKQQGGDVEEKRGKKMGDKDALSSFLPQSFGKKRKGSVSSQQTKKQRYSKTDPYALPTKKESHKRHTENTEEIFQAPITPKEPNPQSETLVRTSSSLEEAPPLPISESVWMKGHSGSVLCMDIDPSGSRLISGSNDYHVRFWDFAGMMSDFRSFRSVEVEEGHTVVSVQYSETGSHFLVSTGSMRPRLYDRDGHLVTEYNKGDPYIMDMQHTSGHTAKICSVAWDQDDGNHFVTASSDATIRVWDINTKYKQKHVIKVKSQQNPRLAVTCMTTSPYGHTGKNMVAAGCLDGSIQLWPIHGPHRMPSIVIRDAHQNRTETSAVLLSKDGKTLISRGGDDTVKFWDLRNFKSPLAVHQGLENVGETTGLCFSPNERMVLTGTSTRPGKGKGYLCFFDTKDPHYSMTEKLEVGDSSVVSVKWHDKLNQIMVGCGDGAIKVYHSSLISSRGVLMGKNKDPKKKKIQGYVMEEDQMNIQNPNSLSLFRPEPSTTRRKLKDRRDPIKSKKPDLPVAVGNKGHGGHVGTALSQHLVRNMIIVEEQVRDPREALLKYSDKEGTDQLSFFGDAYKKTQPKTIFSKEPIVDDPNATPIKRLK